MFVVQLEIGCRDLTCMLSMSSTVTTRVILADSSLLDLVLLCSSALSWDPLLIDSECHISFQFCSRVFYECEHILDLTLQSGFGMVLVTYGVLRITRTLDYV